jgi:predicted 2-oxoglutarate/Fe(II)-dependent dioxygenase YbiX
MQYGTYKIFTPKEALEVRAVLETQEWKQGKARTDALTGSIKQNLELKPEDGDIVKAMSQKCGKAINECMPLAMDTYFKRMMLPKFNKYDQATEPAGGAYHRHTDAPWMGPIRTDFTAVLALTDPSEYVGGDHHVVDPHQGEMIFRPKIGEMMIYETRWAHWVDNVVEGTRISALTWIESKVPDADKRALLKVCRSLSADAESKMSYDDPDDGFRRWFVDMGQIHSQLMRMWCDPV